MDTLADYLPGYDRLLDSLIVPEPNALRELVIELHRGPGYDESARALRLLLDGTDWSWPHLEYWRERFRSLGVFPVVWAQRSDYQHLAYAISAFGTDAKNRSKFRQIKPHFAGWKLRFSPLWTNDPPEIHQLHADLVQRFFAGDRAAETPIYPGCTGVVQHGLQRHFDNRPGGYVGEAPDWY